MLILSKMFTFQIHCRNRTLELLPRNNHLNHLATCCSPMWGSAFSARNSLSLKLIHERHGVRCTSAKLGQLRQNSPSSAHSTAQALRCTKIKACSVALVLSKISKQKHSLSHFRF